MNTLLQKKYLGRGIAFASLALAITAGACTINTDKKSDGTDQGGASSNDDTSVVESSRATALVTAHLDASISADVHVTVNGSARAVTIAPDNSFVLRDIASGQTKIGCESGGIKGEVVIDSVAQGELIELEIRREVNVLVIVVVNREIASEQPREIVSTAGSPLEIRANNVCYFLRAGTYRRDVHILGNNVKLVGAPHDSCDGSRSVLTGTLLVKGNHATVYDVDLQGQVIVTGNHARLYDPCTSFFTDGTTCRSRGCNVGTTEPADGGVTVDAGTAPLPDAGTGSTEDAGSSMIDASPDAAL